MTGVRVVLPRVLSHPPRNDYVDGLHGHAATLVHRNEPWPQLAQFHDPDWVTAHKGDWDVVHFHFSWEQYSPERLQAVLDAHVSAGTSIVWTAHDLRNPHTPAPDMDTPYLAALAASANHVVTLTPGAAREVATRFGRQAFVVPHPPILTMQEITTYRALRPSWARRRSGGSAVLRVLLLAKSLRMNLDWRTPMEMANDWDSSDPAIHLDVYLHDDVRDHRAINELALESTRVTITTGPRLSRDELCRRIVAANVLLLPYAWGTHSGMAELATDLGVPVVVTDVGHYREQVRCHVVGVHDGRVRRDDLRRVLCDIATGTADIPMVAALRRALRLVEFRRQHARIYRE